jgi:hypothetical protein
MVRFLKDKYDFRGPIGNLLQIPCVVVWIYLLMFVTKNSWVPWVLGFTLGLVSGYVLSWLIFLIGHLMFSENRCDKDNDS